MLSFIKDYLIFMLELTAQAKQTHQINLTIENCSWQELSKSNTSIYNMPTAFSILKYAKCKPKHLCNSQAEFFAVLKP